MRPHPVSGMARINLTFRRLDPQSAARAPSCKCGQKAVLKVNGCTGMLPSSSATRRLCSTRLVPLNRNGRLCLWDQPYPTGKWAGLSE